MLKCSFHTILPIFFIICTNTSLISQIDKEYQIKDKSYTGLNVGAYLNNTIIEVGIGHIFIDKPCNRSTHRAFGPVCSFPKKLEVDLTWEFNIEQKGLYGQKITLLYTLFSWQDTKNFNYKVLYHSIGHLLFGLSAVNYTNFMSNKVFFRPEIGWMAPQRLGIYGNHYSRSKLQMNMRVTYAYNITSSEADIYNMSRHQVGALFLFLYSKK